jgi:O-antigen/teichoic acid export membrane protein
LTFSRNTEKLRRMVNKNILTGALIFSILSLLLPLSNFLLLPIYTKYFPPEEFGVLAIMTSFSNLIAAVGAFRISTALMPYYFEYKDFPEKFNQLYGTIVQFTIIVGVITLLLGVGIGPFLFKILFKNDQNFAFFPLGILALISGVFNTLKSPYLVRARIEKKVYKYAIFFCFNSLTTITFQLIMIIQFNAGILGVLIARVISEVACSFIIIYDTYPLFKLKIKKEFLIKSLKFCLPLTPLGAVGWAYAFGDRFFIERYVNLESVGIYSILITITSLVLMISDALISGIQPYIYDYYSSGIKDHIKSINNIFKLYAHFILLFCSFLVMLGCNLHLFHIRLEYTTIYEYVCVGILVFLIEAYSKIYFTNLLFIKKTKMILYLSIISVIFVFTLYFILIPYFGIWGAIFANIISNTAMLIISYILSQRNLFVSLSLIDFLFIPIIVCLVFIGTQLIIHFKIIDYSIAGILQFVFISLFLIIINRKALIILKMDILKK